MTTLTIDDLFVPADAETWNEQLLDNAETLELKTTSWQSGGMSRTILAIMSNMFAQGDGLISIMAQGGFLDFAATGSVTYTAANGETVTQKVTPDPSIPSENPTAALGWLDVLASSVYNVVRIGAEYAANDLIIANTTTNTYGPYAPGTYHVSNPDSSAGYANTETLTINPANIVGTAITAATNTSPIVITTSAVHGLVGTEVVYISGVLGNTAANGFWRITVLSTTTFALNGSLGNGSYASGGTVNVCTVAAFQADVAGPASTSAPGSITQVVTVLTGVSVYNLDSFVGSTWETNVALADRCRLKVQSISPNGPKGAYAYFALSANKLLAEQETPVLLSSPITRVLVQTSATTGIVSVIVANSGGAVSGVSNMPVVGATNASPIVVTSGSAHGLTTGDYVTIEGVVGNTNANGTFNIVVLSATTFSLNGSSGNAAYSSGGVINGGDLGQVNKIIQANAVPDDITALTKSAISFNVAVAANVEIPQANIAIYTAAVQTGLALYFATLPIGGIDNEIDYDIISGVLVGAGQIGGLASYVRKINTLTLNGLSTNITYASPQHVAQLSPAPAIVVVGV